MKKALTALTLTAALLLSSCAETNESENSDKKNTVSAENTENAENNEASENTESSENLVYGEVHEVIGNLLVLNIIDSSAITRVFSDGFNAGNFGSDGFRTFNIDELSEEERASMQERMQERMIEGGMSEEDIQAFQEGGFRTFAGDGQTFPIGENEGRVFSFAEGEEPQFFSEDGAIPAEGRRGAGAVGAMSRAERELEYTGEQKEVIIPVGIPIMSYSFTTEGMTEVETDISSIKSGSVIMITYSADGSIEKVLLTSA